MTRPDAAPTPRAVLRAYFHAKDENRPQVMRQAFAPDATLDIVNRSASIAFPARTEGHEAIADVLVRAFGRSYENVRTFYLDAPPPDARRFSCDWLVAMSDKERRSPRVGCGRYDWTFDTPGTGLASGLVITIEAMLVLEPALLDTTLEAIDRLDYPWTTAEAAAAVLRTPPGLASALGPVLAWLERGTQAG